MSDLISRKALIERFSKLKGSDTLANMFVSDVIREIKNQPPVEAVPVVHGEWIADERGIYFCSICDSEAYWDTDYGQQLFNHCLYCGADMRKKV